MMRTSISPPIRTRQARELEPQWDSGYIACMARYESPECVEEEYIDLVPILRNLYLDPDRVLCDIKEVTIEYV